MTIYLREGAEPFLDSQTHLWVTGTKADPQRVPRAKVGEGCRRSADVVIEQE